MKKAITICSALLLLMQITACNPRRVQEDAPIQDSIMVELEEEWENEDLVDNFFKEFQQENDGWTKSKKGIKKLKDAFKKKMTTDIAFAKACASYKASSEFSNRIANSESIGPYEKKDGEEGEWKAFDFLVYVDLIKPLYNGTKQIMVKYEIITPIPSTVEEHWRPYVKTANHCDVFDSFLKNQYKYAFADLGCYTVLNKQE